MCTPNRHHDLAHPAPGLEMVVIGYPQADHLALLRDLVSGFEQSLAGDGQVAGLYGLDAILGLGVIGAEHDSRHVRDELAALSCGIVKREVCGRSDRRLIFDRLFDR